MLRPLNFVEVAEAWRWTHMPDLRGAETGSIYDAWLYVFPAISHAGNG